MGTRRTAGLMALALALATGAEAGSLQIFYSTSAGVDGKSSRQLQRKLRGAGKNPVPQGCFGPSVGRNGLFDGHVNVVAGAVAGAALGTAWDRTRSALRGHDVLGVELGEVADGAVYGSYLAVASLAFAQTGLSSLWLATYPKSHVSLPRTLGSPGTRLRKSRIRAAAAIYSREHDPADVRRGKATLHDRAAVSGKFGPHW